MSDFITSRVEVYFEYKFTCICDKSPPAIPPLPPPNPTEGDFDTGASSLFDFA